MIHRFFGAMVTVWAFGFLWFALFLPQPLAPASADGVIVPTGGAGRIERGLQLIEQGQSKHLLVTGVDPEVKPREFAAEYKVPKRTMECCVTLDFAAVDTRTNARESAAWVAQGGYKSVRLVTTDWHMRRAAFELSRMLPSDVEVVRDAVRSKPKFDTLFLEYHKLIAAVLVSLWQS